jgi:hypothetical protein
LGFFLGYLATCAISERFFRVDASRFVSLAVAVLGAIGGCVVGVLRQGIVDPENWTVD